MYNTPEVESLQNKHYFEHNKLITAGLYYHQNNYCRQITTTKIVKLVSISQGNSKLPVEIGFTIFHHTEHHFCKKRCKSLNLLYLIARKY
jgi:hypothetical protein